MARQYFGTDGVRGIVGESLTADLVERLGKAATLWCGGGSVLVGRDTRASGPELEEAFARGVVSAGGTAVLAGVLPTPAVALLRLDLGAVVSASHNPPEYNGVKFFDRDGGKLDDASEEEIEALLDAPAPRRRRGRARSRRDRAATSGSCSSASAASSAAFASRSTAPTAPTRASRHAHWSSWALP